MNKYGVSISMEKRIEIIIRRFKIIVPAITLMTAVLFYWVVIHLHKEFEAGSKWVIIPAAFLVHSMLIITIHEATHQNITRNQIDRWILNLASAVVFMPYYGEHYRKYHLIHHVNTNSELDPVASPTMKALFSRNRYLYIALELIPLLYTFYLMLSFDRNHKYTSVNQKIKLDYRFLAMSFLLSISIFFIFRPNIFFLLGTLFVLNMISSIRNWCEHMGTELNKKSNTYWFPMGMGIGNHDIHHQKTSFSWISLMVGLYFKPINTNPIKCLKGILFDKSFTFYER